MSDTEQITSLIGREVYSKSGVFVGEIEDVRLDLDGNVATGLALAEPNADLFEEQLDDNVGVIIPYRWVIEVGDIVLINDVVEWLGDDEEELAV